MSAQSWFPVLIVYLMSVMADPTDHSNRDLKQCLQQWQGVVSWLHLTFLFFFNATLNFPILLWVSLFIAFFLLLLRRCTHVPSISGLISVHTSSVRGNNKSQVTASINKVYWCPWEVNQSGVFGTCNQQWDTRCCCCYWGRWQRQFLGIKWGGHNFTLTLIDLSVKCFFI